MDPSLLIARAAVLASRAAWRVVPGPVRRQLEDRVFYAVFHLTRVENDAYGWRPPAPGGSAPPDTPARTPA